MSQRYDIGLESPPTCTSGTRCGGGIASTLSARAASPPGAPLAVSNRVHRLTFVLSALLLSACFGGEAAPLDNPDLGMKASSLTAAERRVRAAQIRDAAAANGITQGWLLAGIADAETRMSHCWSELTWACQGPNSSDCGGGPVVAGAGDGPCSLRQGGLGMFQFDAGTFDDTLRREGDRVLYIAGNVAAAVDFVVNMVIRSTYVSGVDNRAQAIDWINGVRIGNGRWDPWIRTVTHYYNGCRPSYSCFSSRYAHYRDNTTGVYSEMGADFWDPTHDFAAEFVSQSFPFARDPFELYPGQEQAGYIELRNVGTETWTPGVTMLGTTQPRDAASPIAGSDWVSPNRAATVDAPVAPGDVGRFAFSVRGPDTLGDHPQYFTLVQEGVAWFSDQGGPPDDQLQVRVTSVAAPACADSGPEWSCDGLARVRCQFGETLREPCMHGCVPMGGGAVCAGPPSDMDLDGDGALADVDCDDEDATVYPGATEICGDGRDQDCDGNDVLCGAGGDGGMFVPVDAGPGGGGLTGGCSASGARVGPTWLALLGLLALGATRLRRRLES